MSNSNDYEGREIKGKGREEKGRGMERKVGGGKGTGEGKQRKERREG